MKRLAQVEKSIHTEIAQTKAHLAQLEAAYVTITGLLQGKPVSSVAKGARAGKPRNKSGLPATGAEFWFGVLGSGKKTMNEIVEGALKKLKLDDSARKVIAARATSWLYPAIKAGTVVPAGEKRDHKAYQAAE